MTSTIGIRLNLEGASQVSTGVSRVKGDLDGLGSAASSAGNMLMGAFSLTAITAFAGKLVSTQREFDVLSASLKTLAGGSEQAEREMAWLKDFAKQTPFGLNQAIQGFVKMKALGLEPTRAALTSFGNTASAMGKDLNQMIEAVADASTGEFERLKEFGIKAKKEGNNVELTFQGVTTKIKNSAEEITGYLEDIGNNQFGGAMEERAKTLDGAISSMGDSWDEMFRTISSQGAGTLIYDTVTLASGAIEDATAIIRAMGGAADDASKDIGALATMQTGLGNVFETVAVLGVNLKYILVGIGTEIGGIVAQFSAMGEAGGVFTKEGRAAWAAVGAEMRRDAEDARREVDATTARILGAREAQAQKDKERKDEPAASPRRAGKGNATGTTSKTELSDYDKLMQRLTGNLAKSTAEAEQAQHGYNKAQTDFLELAASPAWAKLTNNQRANVAVTYEQIIANEQAADAQKTLDKANTEAGQTRQKYLESLTTGLDKIRAETVAQQEATARMGLSKEAVAALDMAKLDMLATDLELQAIKAMDRNLDEQTYDALMQQAQAYRELGAAKRQGAAREMALDLEKANTDAAKKAADDWQRASEKINDTLTDALMRGFESGKDFAKNMRDTVANMFKTMVLRPVISAVLSPVSGAINGAVSSAAGSVGSSMLTSIGGSVLGNTVVGGMGGLSSGFMSGMSETLLGSQFVGPSASAAGGTIGLGAQIGAVAPYLAAAAAIFAIAKSLDDSGTYHTGGAAQYNATSGLMSGQSGAGYNIGFGRVEAGADSIKAVGGIAQALGTALDGVAVAFGQKAGYEIATAFADDTSKDGAWGALRISMAGQDLLNWESTRQSKWAPREFGDGQDGYNQYLAAVAKDTRQVLLDMDLPGWADTVLNAIGDSPSIDSLSTALTQIGQAQTVFKSFGQYMTTFATLADSSVTKLAAASGGLGALAGNMSTFVDQFYTDGEKLAVNTANVREAMGKLGFELPATRDEFKALVQAQLALGDAGADTAAGLLGLSGAFASIVPVTEAVTESVKDMTASLDDYISSNVRNSVQADYLRGLEAVGNTAELKRLGIPGYASGGYHPGGLRLVGENGPELEVTGPANILSNPVTSALLGGRGSDAATVTELKGLRSDLQLEIKNLRIEVRAVVVQTAKAADIWERVTPGRNAVAIATPYGPAQVATPAGQPLAVDQVA